MKTWHILSITALLVGATPLAQAASLVNSASVTLLNELEPLSAFQKARGSATGIFEADSVMSSSPFLENFTRSMTLNIIKNPDVRTGEARVPFGPATNGFVLENGSEQTSIGTLNYTLNTSPIDFTQGNATGIALELGEIVAGVRVGLKFGDIIQTFSVPDTIATDQILTFQFSEFSPFDFSAVTSYSIFLDSDTNNILSADASIKSLITFRPVSSSVPEPTSILSLLTIGLFGLFSFHRKS